MRALNIAFDEQLWPAVKFEDINPRNYQPVPELDSGLMAYFRFYNGELRHTMRGGRSRGLSPCRLPESLDK